MAESISRRGLVLSAGLGAMAAGIGCECDPTTTGGRSQDDKSTTIPAGTKKERIKHFLDYISTKLAAESWPPQIMGKDISSRQWIGMMMPDFATFHGGPADVSGSPDKKRFLDMLSANLESKKKAWEKLKAEHTFLLGLNHDPLNPHEADEIIGATPPP